MRSASIVDKPAIQSVLKFAATREQMHAGHIGQLVNEVEQDVQPVGVPVHQFRDGVQLVDEHQDFGLSGQVPHDLGKVFGQLENGLAELCDRLDFTRDAIRLDSNHREFRATARWPISASNADLPEPFGPSSKVVDEVSSSNRAKKAASSGRSMTWCVPSVRGQFSNDREPDRSLVRHSASSAAAGWHDDASARIAVTRINAIPSQDSGLS